MQVPAILRLTKRKVVILTIIILAIVLGFSFFGRTKQQPLQFTTVERQDIKSIVSASGTLTGKSTLNLRFKVPGKLSFINVDAGDSVFTGQLIAGLDTRELDIALSQAENTLRDKQAIVDKVLDDIHLFQYGNGGFANVGSASETMTQRQLRTSAEVVRDNAFDSVKSAKRAFEDFVIISPIKGIVTQAIQIPGQTVFSSDLIAQIVDTSNIYLDTEVDEADFSSIKEGLAVEITFDAYPDKAFQGSVEKILPQVKATAQGANVITARIRLDKPVLTFINGLTGQASIITSEAKNTLVIPLEALREDNTVVLQKDQGQNIQKVTPGISSETEVEIKEGLEEGQKVLLNPPAG